MRLVTLSGTRRARPGKIWRRRTAGVQGHRRGHVPLVGGKIENFIGSQLVELLIAEQRFTTRVDHRKRADPQVKLCSMSRRMDYTIEFDAPAEKIYQDFTSREYWETLMDAVPLPDAAVRRSRLLLPTRTAPTSSSCRICRRMYMPPMGARGGAGRHDHHPRSSISTRSTPTTNRASGHYRASVPARPGHFGGQLLPHRDRATGSELRLGSVCKVNIPLVGGTLEQLVLDGIRGFSTPRRRFTADWISGH